MQEWAVSFYKSQAWKKCRAAYAKKANHLCENCLQYGIYRPGDIVHHVIALTPENIEIPEISLSFANLQLLCRDCHAEIHGGKSGRRYKFDTDGEVLTAR